MDKNILDNLSHQRWLINNNFINDLHKDNLFVYGSLVHKNIEAVYVKIVFEKRSVEYDLYVSNSLKRKIEKFNKLRYNDSLISMFRFKRLLKKEGNLDFSVILNRFIKDYCGNNWSASVNIHSIGSYRDNLNEEKEVQKN